MTTSLLDLATQLLACTAILGVGGLGLVLLPWSEAELAATSRAVQAVGSALQHRAPAALIELARLPEPAVGSPALR